MNSARFSLNIIKFSLYSPEFSRSLSSFRFLNSHRRLRLGTRLGNYYSPRQIFLQSGRKFRRIWAWGAPTSGDALIHSWWCCGWPDLGHGTPKLQVYIVKIEVFLSRLIVCNPSPQNKSHPLGDRRHGIYLLMLHWHVVRLIGTWRRPLLLILRPA
jgi:hypothetical protein